MKIVDRAKKILVNPKEEWEVINAEKISIGDMFSKYALILAAIPAIAGFIGFAILGISYGFGSYTLPFSVNIKWLIATYILSLVGVYVIAFVIDLLAPTFGSTKNMDASMKVVVFSYTASWVGGIFNIIPSISFLSIIAGIYSLFLMYWGLQRVKNVPPDKIVGYFVTTIIVTILIFWITGALVSSFVFGSLGAMPGTI